jgi:ABC1 atypical kinase-like domain
VHKARLHENGAEVAVKIQYLGLETAVYADLATLQVLARVAAWAFPKAFDFGWVVSSLQVRLRQACPRLLNMFFVLLSFLCYFGSFLSFVCLGVCLSVFLPTWLACFVPFVIPFHLSFFLSFFMPHNQPYE